MNGQEELIQGYLDLIAQMKAISNLSFPAAASGEEILTALSRAREEADAIQARGIALLKDPMLGLDLAPAQMQESQAEALRALAGRLLRFSNQKDLGLFWQIHQQLLAYAEAAKNRDLEIEEHYYCGLAMYYLRTPYEMLHMDTDEDDVLAHFSANARLLNEIDSFADHDTQFFIIRSVANVKLGYSMYADDLPFSLFHPRPGDRERYIAQQHLDVKILSDPKLAEKLPYLPWDTIRYAITTGTMSLLSYLRDTGDEQEAAFVYEQSRYIAAHLDETARTEDRFIKPRLAYYLAAARFHVGRTGIDELLQILFDTVDQADRKDYSLDGIYQNLDLGCYALAYWGRYSRQEKWRPRLDAIRMHADSYMRSMPDGESAPLVAQYIFNQILLNDQLHLSSDADYLLRSLMVLDRPTYVHSLIVSETARAIGTWLLEQKPLLFADLQQCLKTHGQPDTGPFLLEMIRMAGLYCDVGKLAVQPSAAKPPRTLLKKEIEIQDLHTYAGYLTLQLHPDTQIYAETALGHHCWHDGSHGCPSYALRTGQKTALAVDIVAASDWLTAAVDPIRSSSPMSFEEAVCQMAERSGTQFHPVMREALQDQDLQKRLRQILDRGLKATYTRIYRRQEVQDE